MGGGGVKEKGVFLRNISSATNFLNNFVNKNLKRALFGFILDLITKLSHYILPCFIYFAYAVCRIQLIFLPQLQQAANAPKLWGASRRILLLTSTRFKSLYLGQYWTDFSDIRLKLKLLIHSLDNIL